MNLKNLMSTKVAWGVLAASAIFWVLAGAGVLKSPSDTSPMIVLGWLYLTLLSVILTTALSVAAIIVLLHNRRRKQTD